MPMANGSSETEDGVGTFLAFAMKQI